MDHKEIHGILNVLKPPGMTSHDVVSFIRQTLKIRKAGHTGTLDPGVAGVLPVCLGKATKIIEYMSDDIKEYRAEITLGRSTDTHDGFGRTVHTADASVLDEIKVREAVMNLVGRQEQVPPMVSALKFKGRKLYELAREGIEVDRKSRVIQVFEINIVRCQGFGTPNPKALFDIKCSKGTYIRTVCHDLGERLGCGGFMSFLIRTGTGMFRISEALLLEEISQMVTLGNILQAVLPLERALSFERVWVYDGVVQFVRQGNRIFPPGVEQMPFKLEENQLVQLVNRNIGCLAVAKVLYDKKPDKFRDELGRYIFQPVKVFC